MKVTFRPALGLSVLLIGLVCVQATLSGLLLKQAREITRLSESEEQHQLERDLSGLRFPYEMLLWNTRDFGEVARYRFAKCKELGVRPHPYAHVLNDDPSDWPPTDSVACQNASFENYWLNHYWHTTTQLLWQLRTERGAFYEAVQNKDERTLKAVRLHVGRALRSRVDHLALASAKLWLAVFGGDDEVCSRLAEFLTVPYRSGEYVTESGESFRDYSDFAVEAVLLIDEYDLDVPYPADLKIGRAYARKSRSLDR